MLPARATSSAIVCRTVTISDVRQSLPEPPAASTFTPRRNRLAVSTATGKLRLAGSLADALQEP